MDIEFYRIIFDLFLNQWNYKFASKYIKREFEKAKKENYDAEYFFESCIMVIDELEKELIYEVNFHEPNFQGYIELIEEGRVVSSIPEIFHRRYQESREEHLLRIKSINRDNFCYSFKYRNSDNVEYKIPISGVDLLHIKEEINKTYLEIINQTGNMNKRKLEVSFDAVSKIDLIRILNSLHEMNFIKKSNHTDLTKQEFMESFGEFLNVDFSKYDSNLSQALNESSLESNLKIFEKMKEITSNSHYQNKNNKK